ncbi:uncharacterized protein LOC119448162 [Dermacentor silvarum]|uniref:uncharacterized protein LOC119448162 n=1 Tax=Dermacentor silvarum TaxID=543639 RepID=UPI001897396F|nr:uncharacterized protein LOC119448162 [Dermacentor silvarum]
MHGVHRTIYADDITIWTSNGSDGQIEIKLQESVHKVEQFLAGTGLRLSPGKSELLLYRPTLKGRTPKGYGGPTQHEEIKIHTQEGIEMPKVRKIKVLGMLIETNGVNGETVNKLTTKVSNVVRLIRRITNNRNGMTEESTIRLIHAFAISHIAYVATFHNWSTSKRNKINVLIRRTFKLALGVPDSASTKLLLEIGLHNMLEEITEA